MPFLHPCFLVRDSICSIKQQQSMKTVHQCEAVRNKKNAVEPPVAQSNKCLWLSTRARNIFQPLFIVNVTLLYSGSVKYRCTLPNRTVQAHILWALLNQKPGAKQYYLLHFVIYINTPDFLYSYFSSILPLIIFAYATVRFHSAEIWQDDIFAFVWHD